MTLHFSIVSLFAEAFLPVLTCKTPQGQLPKATGNVEGRRREIAVVVGHDSQGETVLVEQVASDQSQVLQWD